jgi:hypothetical protein
MATGFHVNPENAFQVKILVLIGIVFAAVGIYKFFKG